MTVLLSEQILSNKTTVEYSTSSSIPVENLINKKITNRGQSVDMTLTLPSFTDRMFFTFVVIEDTTATIRLDPQNDERIILNGVELDDGDAILISGANKFDQLSCYTVTDDGVEYKLIAEAVRGIGFSDGG